MQIRFVGVAVAAVLMAPISGVNAAAPIAASGVVAPSRSDQATEKPCAAAEADILVNLTYNHGCEGIEKKTCREFSACIRKYNICVVNYSDGKVIKGNSLKDISAHGASVSFGINQALRTKNHAYCVMGGYGPLSGWYYQIYMSNGWYGAESDLDRYSSDEGEVAPDVFLRNTSNVFKKFVRQGDEP